MKISGNQFIFTLKYPHQETMLLCTNEMNIPTKKTSSQVDIDDDKIRDLLLSQGTIFQRMLRDFPQEKAAIRSRKRKEHEARQSIIFPHGAPDTSALIQIDDTDHDGDGDVQTSLSTGGKQDQLNFKRKRSGTNSLDDLLSSHLSTHKEVVPVECCNIDDEEEFSTSCDDDFYNELETIIQNDPHPGQISNLSADPREKECPTNSIDLSKDPKRDALKADITNDDDDLDKDEPQAPANSKTTTTRTTGTTRDSIFRTQLEKLDSAMSKSRMSQQKIHEWDRKMGLRRNHCTTMRLSMRSRGNLRNLHEEETLSSIAKDVVVAQKEPPLKASIELARSA